MHGGLVRKGIDVILPASAMRSIRTILFSWFSIVIVGLFLATGAVLYSVTERLLAQFFIEDNSQALGFIAQNIRAHYAANLRALDKLAAREGFSPLNLSSVSNHIGHFLENDNFFGRVELYSPRGELLSAHDRQSSSSREASRENLFKKWDRGFVETVGHVLQTGKPLATPSFRRSNGEVYQSYIVPIFGLRRVVTGLLVGAVYYDEHQFRYFMEGLKLGDRNFLLLTDAEGNLLAQDGIGSETPEAVAERISSLQPQIQQASDGFYGNARGKVDGLWIDRVSFKNRGSYHLLALPIEPFKLVLMLGANDHAISHKQAVLLKWMFVTLVVVLVFSFFASGYVSGVLSKPFLLLIDAHERLYRGELSVRVEYGKHDEIGFLCDSFNKLSRKIDKARLLGNLWGKDAESSSERQP